MRIELSSFPKQHWLHPADRLIFTSKASRYFDYVREIKLEGSSFLLSFLTVELMLG